MLKFEKTFQKYISKKIINKFECKFWVVLPKEYINFLLKYNWGILKNTYLYLINENQWEDNLNSFYWININETFIDYFNKKSNYNYLSLEKNIRFLDLRLPKWFIPISNDWFWNELCLCVIKDSNNYWKVYFWDHENENPDEDEEPWMENMYLISDTFTEFLENIKEDTEEISS